MKIIEKDSYLEIADIDHFDTDHIFDCGQCFRWDKNIDGSYTGIAYGKVISVEYEQNTRTLKIYGSDEQEFHKLWKKYFDLQRDYGAIKTFLSRNDKVMAEAIAEGRGIRILNQEKWETLLSFIISQNNNIPRIRKCINSLAYVTGKEVGEYRGKKYYALPEPEVLARASAADLEPCKLGYRAGYLIKTAQRIAAQGIETLESLGSEGVSVEEAVERLQSYSGVGPKVANCIALFSMGKFDAFPIDVWVRRVMNILYGLEENDITAMKKYAEDHFGEYGGIAQQYLFYYITHAYKK